MHRLGGNETNEKVKKFRSVLKIPVTLICMNICFPKFGGNLADIEMLMLMCLVF